VVTPSCAVLITVMTFAPRLNVIPPDAVPEVTPVPFTVTVELLLLVVGVTVMPAVVLLTLAV